MIVRGRPRPLARLARVGSGSAVALALAIAPSASAAAPTLKSVDAVNRHPSATFSAPKASSATMYVATKPDRTADGSFVAENVVTVDELSGPEISSGKWVSKSQVPAGAYYVMLSAVPAFHACYVYGRSGQYRPSCAAGYSNVLPLTVSAS
jgi:hypothetical protein